MSIIIGLVLLVALAAGGFAFALARSGRRQYEAQGQVVPGVASEVPAAWAGAHTREAKLHRRLGESVRALQSLQATGNESVRMLELRVELEQQALEVDRRLIAAASLPTATRDGALDKVEQAVVTVEQAATELVTQAVGDPAGDRGLQGVAEQVRLAAEARAELEQLEQLGIDAVGPPTAPARDDEDPTPQAGTA